VSVDLIRSRLGDELEEFALVARGREWTGFRAPAPLPSIHEDVSGYYEQKARVLESVALDSELRAADIRYFVGLGGAMLYAVPGLPPIDVVEFMRVGTHNGLEDHWKAVQSFVAATIGQGAFDVVFADEAGLDARAAEPIGLEVARGWDRLLLDHAMQPGSRWFDSYTFMLDRAVELGLTGDPEAGGDPGGEVAAFIHETGSIRLWWD